MLYLRTFLISAPLLAAMYWLATQGGPRPLALWPDTAIMGGFMGLLACFIRFNWRRMRYEFGLPWRIGRILKTHWRQNRTR